MYGKPYVVQRLKMPNRYYAAQKGKWHILSLDGNNKDISLDEEQLEWLKQKLAAIPKGEYALLMSHYPILGVTPKLVGGGHSDAKLLKDLFYQHRDVVRICISGHNHLHDDATYNNVRYCCNGAMSGFWWGKGDKDSAGIGYYQETPAGYAIIHLHDDGNVTNEYIPHTFTS